MRFLTRQARNVTKLLNGHRTRPPGRRSRRLPRRRFRSCGIRGVHVYPLGGLKKSARWAQAVVDGRFEMREDAQGFIVDNESD